MTDFITDDIFWDLLNKTEVFHDLAKAIVTSPKDLSETLELRAVYFMQERLNADAAAWLHFYELNPNTLKLTLTAHRLLKKVFVVE